MPRIALLLNLRQQNIRLSYKSSNLHVIIQTSHTHIDMSEEEISKHEKWYQQYSDLLKKQKEAIELWRKNKDNHGSTAKSTSSLFPSRVVKSQVPDVQNVRKKIIQWKVVFILKKNRFSD